MEHRPLKPDADTREHLVVIGNGMAGCRAVEELLARDPSRYRVTIFGAEPRVNYNRIMLSPVLAGEKCFDDIVINDAAWYADNGIALVAGDPVAAIDRAAKTVTARSGLVETYDLQQLPAPGRWWLPQARRWAGAHAGRVPQVLGTRRRRTSGLL